MKKLRLLLLTALMALSLTACVPADFDPVQWMTNSMTTSTNTSADYAPAYSGLPANYAEFRDRCQSACQSPYGAAKMYFDAVFCYMDPRTRSEASKMLRFIMHEKQGWERSPNFSMFAQRMRDPKQHIFRSFAEGTSPENDYSMDPNNYQLMMGELVEDAGYMRLFLYSSGADSPRPIWVKQFDDGLWYVINVVGTYAGVRDPYSAKNHYGHDTSYDRYRRY